MIMKNYYIDDITWNDLSMEQVYDRINRANSSVGQEYLKKILRNCIFDESVLKNRSGRADYFTSDPDYLKSLQKVFRDLGKTKKISLHDYIFRFNEIKPSGNAAHYLMILLLLAAAAMIFINPVAGIIALVIMFIVNISTYFKYKAAAEGYFMCFKYIVRMLWAASRIIKLSAGKDSAFNDLCGRLKTDYDSLKPLKRGSWLLTNSVSGSLVDVIMDYIRMLFHVDIIKFNNMRRLAQDRTDIIEDLFNTLGEIESDICIFLYRQSLDSWCIPEFTGHNDRTSEFPERLSVKAMYHPLTDKIVKNDICVSNSVLLTGSNASGKSTFLKQTAINQIFAQTIYTCLADRFKTGFFKVLSSMALTDNILGNESYFIVEIRSLKRIFDEIDGSENENGRAGAVMCFIDEVLRGTNTKERVAASSQILKNLSEKGALCFAATHDIELTSLLDGIMDNYHFEEFVNGNDIEFDYKIKPGPATTRNAIKLMQAYGFDRAITDAANEMLLNEKTLYNDQVRV